MTSVATARVLGRLWFTGPAHAHGEGGLDARAGDQRAGFGVEGDAELDLDLFGLMDHPGDGVTHTVGHGVDGGHRGVNRLARAAERVARGQRDLAQARPLREVHLDDAG
jgi:hypothetical protein